MEFPHQREVITMRHDQRVVACRFMDEMIFLLDEERQARNRPVGPELPGARGNLRMKASEEGAGAFTVGLIRAAEIAVLGYPAPIGADARS